MILEHNTELKAMRLLVRRWYRNFSAYELSKEAHISPPMGYRIIKKLIFKRVLMQEGTKVRLNLDNPFSYAFKMTYDAERILDLSLEDQNKVKQVFSVFTKEYGQHLRAFMIFGSAASGEQTESSDIDLLAIVTKKQEIDYKSKGLLGLGKLNIVEKEEHEFEREYLQANDLVLNALMNGIVVYDQGIVRFLLQKPLPSPSYEVILEKKQRLEVLKKRLFALTKERNYRELVEEVKLFIIEKARVVMLRKGIVPRSKKHIIDSLRSLDKILYKDYHTVNERNVGEVLQRNV